jgi:hypothetical protein
MPLHEKTKSKNRNERNEGISHEVVSRDAEGITELFIEIFDRIEALEKKVTK